MTPETKQKFLEEEKQYDRQFYATLLKDIPYFHRLYAKYHDPLALETAKNLGVAATKIKQKYI